MREDSGLNQTQVATMLGIDQRTYSNYEIGKYRFPIDYLIILATRYNTSVDYLVGLTDNRLPYKRKK